MTGIRWNQGGIEWVRWKPYFELYKLYFSKPNSNSSSQPKRRQNWSKTNPIKTIPQSHLRWKRSIPTAYRSPSRNPNSSHDDVLENCRTRRANGKPEAAMESESNYPARVHCLGSDVFPLRRGFVPRGKTRRHKRAESHLPLWSRTYFLRTLGIMRPTARLID